MKACLILVCFGFMVWVSSLKFGCSNILNLLVFDQRELGGVKEVIIIQLSLLMLITWWIIASSRSAKIAALLEIKDDHHINDYTVHPSVISFSGNDRLKGNLTTVYKNNTYHLHAHHVKEQQYFGATLLANRSTILVSL